MAVNRRPKVKFSQISNSLIETISANMSGIILLFLSKPPGWKMRLEELRAHWSESERSLKRSLKLLREMDHIVIKPYYDKEKKRFAGSYYVLKETYEEKDSKSESDTINKHTNLNEQRHTKSRGSAKAESLQNEGLINNNEVLNNNTDNMYIESNIKGEEQEFDDSGVIDEETEIVLRGNNSSRFWDTEREKLWDKSLNKRHRGNS